jgi:hypothetical protein
MYARTARLPANTRSPAAPAMLRCLPHTALRAYSLLSSTIASTAYAGASTQKPRPSLVPRDLDA